MTPQNCPFGLDCELFYSCVFVNNDKAGPCFFAKEFKRIEKEN